MGVGIGGLKEGAEHPARRRAQGHAAHDGHRNGSERRQVRPLPLGHAQEGGKEHDDKDVVAGGAGHHHLGDALFCAPALLHQAHHAGHHHRRRNRRHHRAHHRRFGQRKAQQHRSQQHIGRDFKAGGHKAHHHRRAAHLFQVRQIQRKARFEQDDDKGHLPQIGADGEDGIIQHIQRARPQHNAHRQHADDAGQVQLLAEGRRRETRQKHERKTC